MSTIPIPEDKSALPASGRIPAIALPFVSERAKKTLDAVCQTFPSRRTLSIPSF